MLVRPRSRYDAGLLVALVAAAVAVFLALVLAVTARPAQAARHWALPTGVASQAARSWGMVAPSRPVRVGLVCRPAFHGRWSVKVCATVHVASIRGRLYARAAGATAGYSPTGRKRLALAGSVRASFGGTGSAGTRVTRRLVVRSGWVRLRGGVQTLRTRYVVWVAFPDGTRERYVLRSRAGVSSG